MAAWNETGRFYSDAEILEIQAATYNEARRWFEKLELELAREIAARRILEEELERLK